MDFMTTSKAAEKWNISDRRVRTLCKEGKIEGAVLVGKTYRIPVDAKKPTDGRMKNPVGQSEYYLKWGNDTIGLIDSAYNVHFINPKYNEVVKLYTHGQSDWSHEQFVGFLSERVVSRDRRDIEKILFRCGLSAYDVLRIAKVTRGIHPKDLLWIAHSEDETLDEIMTEVFESVFLQKIDLVGDSVDTPEGYNIKRYGVMDDRYGIYKQRISPLVTDVESEIAVYKLAEKIGVPCCPVYIHDKNTIFSEFLYDFSNEYIVHFRRLFDGARSDNEYENLLTVRPQYKDDFIRMILLDFITRQDDRHLSNMAVKVTSEGESFYPLYDNGRSLFYEDTEETVEAAVENIEMYATNFGYSGTYYDYICDIANEGVDFSKLINLDITDDEINVILVDSGFKGYRLTGAAKWIRGAIDLIKSKVFENTSF